MANLRRRISVLLFTPISVLRTDPRETLREIILDLIWLKRFLRTVGKPPQHALAEPLYEIVDFFSNISRWHDRGLGDVIAAFVAVNYGQWDRAIATLYGLEAHFERAGRNRFGMNRTERSEQVTSYDVFLGDVHGLFTHPVFYWVTKKIEPKGAHRDYPSLNGYDMVLVQARDFMRSHAEPMVALIEELETIVEGRDRRAA